MRQLIFAMGTASFFILSTKNTLSQNKIMYATENAQKSSSISNEVLNLNNNLSTTVSNKQIVPLKPGEFVPDIYLGEVSNFEPYKAISINDLKGKYVILDFWSIYCSVCIKEFPRFEKLQQKYKDRLLIVTVGFDAGQPNSIKNFISRNKGTGLELRLPTAIQTASDTILTKYFPFQGFPHEVWINDEGKLSAMTDQFAVNESNIDAWLSGKEIKYKPKKEIRVIDICTPFLIYDGKNKEKNKYGSKISGYADTLATLEEMGTPQCNSKVTRIYGVNQSVYSFYKRLYSLRHNVPELTEAFNKRIIFKGDKKNFYQDWPIASELDKVDNLTLSNFMQNNLFCYDLVLPKTTSLQVALDRMIFDLDSYFKVKSEVKDTLLKCYALVRTSSKDKLKANTSVVSSNLFTDLYNVNYKSLPTRSLVSHLNLLLDKLIIDETNYKGVIDFSIKISGYNKLDEIQLELAKYDLNLVEVDRKLKMLILTPISF